MPLALCARVLSSVNRTNNKQRAMWIDHWAQFDRLILYWMNILHKVDSRGRAWFYLIFDIITVCARVLVIVYNNGILTTSISIFSILWMFTATQTERSPSATSVDITLSLSLSSYFLSWFFLWYLILFYNFEQHENTTTLSLWILFELDLDFSHNILILNKILSNISYKYFMI